MYCNPAGRGDGLKELCIHVYNNFAVARSIWEPDHSVSKEILSHCLEYNCLRPYFCSYSWLKVSIAFIFNNVNEYFASNIN